ncbi:hypothetical protein E0Z10_g3024 [Xylaria hypoxylon]|uniref:RNA recognition motif-containing protein n=1 Tax=Xylaria hypoxylon TaxID=37992 RepID=A0A4Z0YN31_9PEZI|nr:hypothetical protein E0Z10_g3024 [Xylaria hypoxylon]
MAVRPGEENVATLFGDIHYFYGPPTSSPPHHRFDKGSYVYLFENASQRRARIEVANQPGTDDQDAFDGFLDRTQVRYSYKQQCLVSITVEGVSGPPTDPSQWHLPTYDPRNENKYHYKLHSLDIYFWTQADALRFVDGVRRVLPASQIEVADEPAPPPSHVHSHSQDMNPLVQKLEKAAISDPRVQQQGFPFFVPPPTTGSSGQNDSPQSFVPMAYNPAAPPEAERHQHREKTPPPEDDGHDPLVAALARDQAIPFSPGYGQTTFSPPPGATGIPGPPSQTYPGPMSPGLPPSGIGSPGLPPTPYGNLQRSTTMPVTGLASPGLTSPYGAHFPGSPGFAPPPSLHPSATAPSQHHPTPPPVQSPGLPPPPPGGYSQFNYNNAPRASLNPEYNIHQQLYRPTEQEHTTKYAEYKPKVEGPSKLGQNAERLERGVTGMFKKFEKKFGV